LIEKIAELLALELITGEKILSMAGDGSFIPIYLHKVGILIGEDEFGMKKGFSSKSRVGFNLPGMDIFDQCGKMLGSMFTLWNELPYSTGAQQSKIFLTTLTFDFRPMACDLWLLPY